MRTGRRTGDDPAPASRWEWWGFDPAAPAPARTSPPPLPLGHATPAPTVPSIPFAGYVLLTSSIVVAAANHLPRFTSAPAELTAVDPMTFQALAMLVLAAVAFLAMRPLRSWRYWTAFAGSLLALSLTVYDLGRLDGWTRSQTDLWVVPSLGWWLVFLGSLCMSASSAWLLEPRHRGGTPVGARQERG